MGARGPTHPEVWGLWWPRDLSWGLCASRACVQTLPSSVCLLWPTMGIRKTLNWLTLVTALWPDSEPASASPGCHHSQGLPAAPQITALHTFTCFHPPLFIGDAALPDLEVWKRWMLKGCGCGWWYKADHWENTGKPPSPCYKPWAFTFEGELLVSIQVDKDLCQFGAVPKIR